jgi:hypothetical protein
MGCDPAGHHPKSVLEMYGEFARIYVIEDEIGHAGECVDGASFRFQRAAREGFCVLVFGIGADGCRKCVSARDAKHLAATYISGKCPIR